jgi:truncated hemoglobin YjbI
MSDDTALLHYGANERKHIMLQKLGGKKVLAEATETFYDRQIQDERLLKFFHGTDLSILKWHQFNLMGIAFTAVPESFDVRHLILNRHQRLFDKGLDESYFDVVMEHFKGTLDGMKVDSELIKESLQVIIPLRAIFEQGAREAQERKLAQARWQLINQVTLSLAIAAVAGFAIKTIRSSKK